MYVGRPCAYSGEPIATTVTISRTTLGAFVVSGTVFRMMSESESVARGVSGRVVAQSVRSIAGRLEDLDTGRFMESMHGPLHTSVALRSHLLDARPLRAGDAHHRQARNPHERKILEFRIRFDLFQRDGPR